MPSFKLTAEYMNRIKTTFERYRRIRRLIHKNINDYVTDFMNFRGTPQDRAEYLEARYRLREPKENYITADNNGKILFHVRDIALLTGRDPSSISRTLSQLERSEGWYSRLIPLRHEWKSANNNSIYVYDQEIFDLFMDYREHKYLERIRLAGAVDFAEVVRYWDYLKGLADYEASQTSGNSLKAADNGESQSLPEIPPVSWADVVKVIGGKLFSVKADMIFALAFAVTFGLARRWTVLIPVFAAVSGVLLVVCALLLRHRASRAELIAEAGAVMTLLALFWGVNLTMENGIYTPGGTVMNLTSPEPALRLEAMRGEYRGWRQNPLVFFVNADNEADIREIFYRTDSGSEYVSSGSNEAGNVQLLLRPKILSSTITIDLKYIDLDGREHGPVVFKFDVEKARFSSGKSAVINHPDLLFLTQRRDFTIINSFMNDTVKAVHYGINTEKPDRVYVPDFDEGYLGDGAYIVSQEREVDFVSLYTEFTDGTSTDIVIKQAERGTEYPPFYL